MTLTVLLADDHAVVRDGLRMILEAEPDIRVVGEAANGRQAVDRVRRLRPDVAVLDIAMPELNGIDAARLIRENHPASQVVMLSMHSSTEHVYRALRAGARGYVLKESAGAEVVEAVRSVARGRRFLSLSVEDAMVDDYLVRRRASADTSPLDSLTAREREVLQMVVEGKSSKEIAPIAGISPKTVETYRSRIMSKLGIRDLPGLVKFAIEHGVTEL